MGSRSIENKTKMGQLPGDLSIRTKVAMMEGKVPLKVFPWQTITEACAKSFRKAIHALAKSRSRQNAKKTIRQEL
jgi:hypothetical protein